MKALVLTAGEEIHRVILVPDGVVSDDLQRKMNDLAQEYGQGVVVTEIAEIKPVPPCVELDSAILDASREANGDNVEHFDVWLTQVPRQNVGKAISIIRLIRETTHLPLKRCKEIHDAVANGGSEVVATRCDHDEAKRLVGSFLREEAFTQVKQAE